jgi:hypothetical protein
VAGNKTLPSDEGNAKEELMEFQKFYSQVLDRVEPAFSGEIDKYRDNRFVTELAGEIHRRHDPEQATLLATDLVLAAMNELAYDTQDVDYDELDDPETRLRLYEPFVSDTFMDHARYHMHLHNAEKGVTYKKYDRDARLQALAIKIQKDGGVGTENWWSE